MGIRKGRSDIKASGNAMKYLKLLLLLLASAAGLVLTACSGSAEIGKNTAAANSSSAAANSNSAQVVATPNRDLNVNSNPELPLKSADMRSRTNSVGSGANVSGTPPPPQFQPADENSEWAVTMNRDGSVTEIRVFKSHPQIARAEVFSRDGRNKVVKIYLRNGKTVDINTDRPLNLKTATANQILEIGGIQSANSPSK